MRGKRRQETGDRRQEKEEKGERSDRERAAEGEIKRTKAREKQRDTYTMNCVDEKQ